MFLMNAVLRVQKPASTRTCHWVWSRPTALNPVFQAASVPPDWWNTNPTAFPQTNVPKSSTETPEFLRSPVNPPELNLHSGHHYYSKTQGLSLHCVFVALWEFCICCGLWFRHCCWMWTFSSTWCSPYELKRQCVVFSAIPFPQADSTHTVSTTNML